MSALDVAPGPQLAKAPFGITGLDQVTNGGIPEGRVTLISGNAGTGKTLLSIEFLVNGIRDHDELAVLVTFEESAAKVAANVRSLGFDLKQMQDDGKLVMLSFKVDPSEEHEHFDFSPFYVLLDDAIKRSGAKRIVLDTIEVLFGAYSNDATMRIELIRLIRWIEDKGVTAIITGERGNHGLTRHGIEEYVSDCVIVLDHRIHNEVSTRRMRVVKYRGSAHGTNEYPFLIGSHGFVILPITNITLDYDVFTKRVSTGVSKLDTMLGGGPYRGSTILVTGVAGTGKTTIGAAMINAACARGEKALMVLFEEAASQLERNMASVGIDLKQWVDAGLLRIWTARPLEYGLENHLAYLIDLLDEVHPEIVVFDGLSGFAGIGEYDSDVMAMIARKIDIVKQRGITAVLTTLGHGADDETSQIGISSLIDTWILLTNIESNGERNRLLFVSKSRGSAHSNQVREFVLSDDGIDLVSVFIGPSGVLTGSERRAQELLERSRHDREAGS